MDKRKKLLAVIDPGHTGARYNAGIVKGYYESQAMYDLSLYEKAALESYGIDVILTRTLNENPGLYDRGQMAVRRQEDYENVIFESNHSNAYNGKACGVVVFRSVSLPESEMLGNKIAQAVTDIMKPSTGITYNRGVKVKIQSDGRDWYGVIRGAVSGARLGDRTGKDTKMYAYIVEHGFHDHPKECRFLSEESNLKALAEGKAKVIAEYFGIKGIHSKIEKSKTKRTCPYLVRVEAEDLNIRKAPTIYSEALRYTGKGIFTIVDEEEGVVSESGHISRWGKLKSGSGWICLDYAKTV